MLFLLSSLSSSSTSESSTTTDGTTSTSLFSSNIFTYVIIVFLVIFLISDLIKRFIRPKDNEAIVILRKNNLHTIVSKNSDTPKYFVIPFVDRVGGIIKLDEQKLDTDKVLINDGPNALYKLHLTLSYKVSNPSKFYPISSSFKESIGQLLNNILRDWVRNDKEAINYLINDFETYKEKIVNYLNTKLENEAIEVIDLKENAIEPLGSTNSNK